MFLSSTYASFLFSTPIILGKTFREPRRVIPCFQTIVKPRKGYITFSFYHVIFLEI